MAFKAYSPVHHPAVEAVLNSSDFEDELDNVQLEDQKETATFSRKILINNVLVLLRVPRPLVKNSFRLLLISWY